MHNDDKLYRIVEAMLYNYKKVTIEIKNLDLDIEELINDYRGCGAISYGERTGQTYKITNPTADEIEFKENKLKYLKTLKRSKEIQIERIDNMLSILSDDEYKLIELRYFKKLQFSDISNILCKSDIYLMQLRKKVIMDKLAPLIKN